MPSRHDETQANESSPCTPVYRRTPASTRGAELPRGHQETPPANHLYGYLRSPVVSMSGSPGDSSIQIATRIDFSRAGSPHLQAPQDRAAIRPRDPRPPVTYYITDRVKKAYWRFIVAVPKDEFIHYELSRLTSTHAGSAYCDACGWGLTYTKGNTAAIMRHVTRHHPDDTGDLVPAQPKKPPLIDPFHGSEGDRLQKKRVVAITRGQQDTLNQLTAMWLAGAQRPFALVNDNGYREIIKYVASLGGIVVSVPSRTTATREVKALASRMRATLKARILADAEFYSLTTDVWSDRAMRSYISLTVHYLENDFSMNNWTLEVESFPGKHTGSAMATALDSAIDSWGLKKPNCVRLVRDGAANAKSGAELLGVPHDSCIAHSLYLVVAGAMIKKKGKVTAPAILAALAAEAVEEQTTVQENQPLSDDATMDAEVEDTVEELREQACEEVDRHAAEMHARSDHLSLTKTELECMDAMRSTVQVFRNLAVYFHKSANGKNRLEHIRAEMNPLTGGGVVVDCPTRWNSCWGMLDRFLDLKETFDEFFRHSASSTEFTGVRFAVPRQEQWAAIRCLHLLSESFASSLTELGGDGYSTLSLAFPCLRFIKTQLMNDRLFDNEMRAWSHESFADRLAAQMDGVRTGMKKIFLKRFRNMGDKILWISYLDPRLTFMDHLNHEEIQRAREFVLAAMAEVVRARERGRRGIAQPSERRPEPSTPKKAMDKMRVGVFGRRANMPLVQNENSNAGECSRLAIQRVCADEFDNYLNAAKSVIVDADPLMWWRSHAATFPVVAAVARKWLCCVATSVSSERAFSSGGNVVTAKRCSLTPSNVRDIVFIAENMDREERRRKDKEERDSKNQLKT